MLVTGAALPHFPSINQSIDHFATNIAESLLMTLATFRRPQLLEIVVDANG
jgi:hypothetical protein